MWLDLVEIMNVQQALVVNKKIWKEITNGNSLTLVPLTRNKLYVACTRARGNVYIICDENTKPYKKVY